MSDKIPLGSGLRLDIGNPFVAYTTDNHVLILETHTMLNAHGDIIWYDEKVVNSNPTEEEIFKVNLKNPQEERQIAWGKTGPNISTGDIVEVAPDRREDN